MPAPIDPKTREEIIVDYAASNSINAIRQKYGVSWATVRKIVGEAEAQINVLREEKQKKYINDAWEVINAYLVKLMDPKTIKEAKARDCINVISGLLERIQRQQELNHQYDVMYHNIEKYLKETLRKEMEDTPVRKALDDFFNNQWEKDKEEMKASIRQKIKVKELPVIDPDENKKNMENARKNLEYMYDQAKKEIIDDIFRENGEDID